MPNMERLRQSRHGPWMVLDAALTMQRGYIAGMDYAGEGARNVLETYVEICTQLDSEMPKYVEKYVKGMGLIVVHLSTAQAQYYEDMTKVFEMVFTEKGLKGSREGYRRERRNGAGRKLRAVSVYRAIAEAEDRAPGWKEPEHGSYGSYGCSEGETRRIWEETAGRMSHASRSGKGTRKGKGK